MKQKNFVNLNSISLIVVGSYIATQMLSDIASLKIGMIMGVAVDMGTFIYPITFTIRDLIHKTLGKKSARTLIILAGFVNLFMALYLWWCVKIPANPSWGLQNEFSAIFSPVWRIVIASIVAEVVSELIDTEIYHWFVHRITSKYQWARVLISNSISVPIDNAIFAFGAFWNVVSVPVLWQIWLANFLVKYSVTILTTPMIYLVPEGLSLAGGKTSSVREGMKARRCVAL